MSNKFAGHCEAASEHHAQIAKGFSGLVSHFKKCAEHHETTNPQLADEYTGAASKCKAMAGHHEALSGSYADIGDEAEKAQANRMNKMREDGVRGVLPDVPASARNRAILRDGGAPLQRDSVPEFGKVDTSDVPVELEDMINNPLA